MAQTAELRAARREELIAGPLAPAEWVAKVAALQQVTSTMKAPAAVFAVGIEVIAAEAGGVPLPRFGVIAEQAAVNPRRVRKHLRDLISAAPGLFPTLADLRGEELNDLAERFTKVPEWTTGLAELHQHFRGPKIFKIARELLAWALWDKVASDELMCRWFQVTPLSLQTQRNTIFGKGLECLAPLAARRRRRGRPRGVRRR
jgi:hypothetical protein